MASDITQLSKKEFWDRQHEKKKEEAGELKTILFYMKLFSKRLIIFAIGSSRVEYFRTYWKFLLFDVILKEFLPQKKGSKILEIGSAPGQNLITFHKKFGFIPYGVEYSDPGVRANKENFIKNGLDPEKVINADFFSKDFQSKKKENFDIVTSFGFVEHFENVRDVIDKHMDLIKPGGYLVVSIPNFRGVNYYLSLFFNSKKLLDIHNLKIMDRKSFALLFDDTRLSTLYCDYYGMFDFGLFGAKGHTRMWSFLIFLTKIQILLNFFFRVAFKRKRLECKLYSPFLLYVGKKII